MSNDWTGKFASDIQLLLSVSRKGTALAAAAASRRVKDSRACDEAGGRRAKYAESQSQAGRGRQRRGWENGRAEGSDRRHPKGRRSRSPYRRRSKSPARARATSPNLTRGHGAGKASKGVCKSRLFTGIKCKFGKCRFSHVCPCCSVDHEDAEKGCATWNASVAKRIAEECNLRP